MPPNSRPNRTMLRRALFLLAACGVAAFAVLMFQLFRLQILRHDELESAALQGDHVALFVLAMCLLEGRLCDRDSDKALAALRRAALAGNRMAASMLGGQQA